MGYSRDALVVVVSSLNYLLKSYDFFHPFEPISIVILLLIE
jgi:hypothetical protein